NTRLVAYVDYLCKSVPAPLPSAASPRSHYGRSIPGRDAPPGYLSLAAFRAPFQPESTGKRSLTAVAAKNR
ncbi:MAG: hypothetical protein KDA45_09990, partial [Planctomycetales bacterium]|nr:hypothetical protein [Planctomycetales bacterium]